MSKTPKEVIERYDALKSQRGTWESHWEEIADRVLPRYSDAFSGRPALGTKGEKNTEKMFDSTAALALGTFAAAMESMLTPRSTKWHRLQSSDTLLNKDRDTQLWFEDANRILFRERYSPAANYASQQHEAYMGLGAFGTAALYVDSNVRGGLRYSSIDLGEILFDINFQGVVDTSLRKFTKTARQMKQMEESGRFKQVPASVSKAAESKPDKEFEIIHCVTPNDTIDPTKADHRGMAFSSYYVCVEENMLLGEGGYDSFPYPISRYVTGPGEIYGRSPAMQVLPNIKTLNEEKKTLLTQGHRVVNPVLLAHDDGVLDTFSLKPGSVNVGGVNAQGQRMVHELPTGNIAAGQEMMDMERNVINDAFLVNLFQILVETPTMTATEVLERVREKGALLSPTMGRQQSEMLGPMIERELDLLGNQGLLPPLTPALIEAEGEYEVVYDSPLSRAQRAEESAGWMRTFESVAAVADTTQDPSALDHFNMDVIVPQVAAINAVPISWMASPDDIVAKREARQQQQQQQQMLDAAPAVSGALKAIQ